MVFYVVLGAVMDELAMMLLTVQTAYGPLYYGPSGAPISTQDGCTLRLEPSGSVRCITSLTDQGQGTLTAIAQIVADSVGVSVVDVGVLGGDSAISTYGGGAWASRGTAIGGEAALKAGAMLKRNILALAGAITQTPVDALDITDGNVVNAQSGRAVISLAEVGRIGYSRQDTLPPDFDVQLSVTASHVANDKLYYMANGVQASSTQLGAKGIGEAGLIGAMGAVWVAVNDALKPLGAKILHQPFTPERVLDALARARKPASS